MGEEREGSFWRRYLRGNGLVSLETEDQKYHSCHLDEQGSTLYLTDGQAEVENRYAYDAFGNLLGQEEAFPNRILYAGQPYDQETGQYYLRARYYNPTIGRFSQEDTYWGDGLNLYAYCANNPVRYFDPSGHQKKPNCPGTEGEAATDKQPGVEIESGRNSSGVVTGSGNGSVSRMMRGTQGNIGLIPQEVADKLSGRSFNNFNEFRSAFWKEVANSTYAKEFSSGNIGRMQKGLAPRVLDTQQYGGALSYVLHHKKPIYDGGGVYDLDNIVIVTPRMHQEILDKAYHFNN